ncbi:MAG: hypothetical protein P1U54_14895 [Immundisolibacteraceae bacterium]|nr:hypothetical protein [Immundisolibacteraceae bacterium]
MPKDTPEFIDQLRAGQLQQLFNYLPSIYFVVKNRHGRVVMANELAVAPPQSRLDRRPDKNSLKKQIPIS